MPQRPRRLQHAQLRFRDQSIAGVHLLSGGAGRGWRGSYTAGQPNSARGAGHPPWYLYFKVTVVSLPTALEESNQQFFGLSLSTVTNTI